ncbi:unnamed protein product [Ceratitis capitata]|uniref:(Mediterranean fruit fly) hypothetical protein n=1 Tax=Ceratitis capitata TaxID=7213 RepID=A0A811UVG9_CERCA|nr:unnamed protein product [Ceratitis capitata]
MEEAKMELMRTAKCPDNQGVPVLILANKQDLPGARNPKDLEKLLGLRELLYPAVHFQNTSSSSAGNNVRCSSGTSGVNTFGKSITLMSLPSRVFGEACTKNFNIQHPVSSATAAESIKEVKKDDDYESPNNSSKNSSFLSSIQKKILRMNLHHHQ